MLPCKLHNSRLPFICLTLTTIVYDTHWSRAVSLLIHTQSAWPAFLLCSRGAGRGPALLRVSCGADTGPCRLRVPRPGAASPRSSRRAGRMREGAQPVREAPPAAPGLGRAWGRSRAARPPPTLSPSQRTPRSAATRVTNSSRPSWTCGATRSTRAARWGPCSTRAWPTSSSPRAWAAGTPTGRPTSARTASGCSPPSTGAAPPRPGPAPPRPQKPVKDCRVGRPYGHRRSPQKGRGHP